MLKKFYLCGLLALVVGAAVVPVYIIFVSDKPVDTANIVAGIVAPATFLVGAGIYLARRIAARDDDSEPRVVSPAARLQAMDVLAERTALMWKQEARDRGITLPAPVRVRWAWEAISKDAYLSSGPIPMGAAYQRLGADSGLLMESGVVDSLYDSLYSNMDHGSLVLVGPGGCGKTGAMLLLLLAALDRRTACAAEERSQVPVPVWLTMSGWNPVEQTLLEWAKATINRDHSYLFSTDVGGLVASELVDNGLVALFLDGFDEIAEHRRAGALARIEAAGPAYRIVMSSRPDEYRAAREAGRLENTVEVLLSAVDPQTAGAYLVSARSGEDRRVWESFAQYLAEHPHSTASRVLRTPLTLSLAREAFRDVNPRQMLLHDHSETSFRNHLYSQLLATSYPDANYRARTVLWLGLIARQMRGSRDLAWWNIGSWAPRAHAGDTYIIVPLLLPMILTFLLLFPLLVVPLGFIGTLFLFAGQSGSRGGLGEPERARNFADKRRFKPLSRVALGAAFLFAIVVSPMGWLPALMVSLMGAIALLCASGLENDDSLTGSYQPAITQQTDDAATPRTAYSKYIRSHVLRAVRVALTLLCVSGIVLVAVGPPWVALVALGVAALLGGAGAFVVTGAFSFILAELRAASRSRGYVRLIPLLEEARSLQILRQAGATYQFRHAELQSYVASLDQNADTSFNGSGREWNRILPDS